MSGIAGTTGQTPVRRLALTVALAFTTALAACGEPTTPGGPAMEIRVKPLQFQQVLRVCYDLAVLDAFGVTLWQFGDPFVNANDTPPDTETICSDEYGTGSGGDIQYIGPCDPAYNPNVVRIVIDGIYTLNGRLEDNVDWLPTCTAAEPCFQYVNCEENENILVEFNILVLRSANQGFFDIAVKFDDVFCSAKVDCSYDADGKQTIVAVHDSATGKEVQTAVVGLACTGGPDTADEDVESILHANDVRLACGDIDNPAQSLVWTCEQDNPSYYGYFLHFPPTGPEIGGTVVTRSDTTLAYDQNELEIIDLPDPYSAGIITRILADADNPREAIAMYVERHVDPSVSGPIKSLAPGIVFKDTTDWEFRQVGQTLDEPIVMPRAFDGKHLLAVNTLEDLVPADGRVFTFPIINTPGDRTLGEPEVFELPEGVSDCGRFQILDGYFIADCYRRAEVAGQMVDGFEVITWLAAADNPADYTVLRPDVNEPHFRLALVDQAGLRVEETAVVLALTTHVQWSQPATFVPNVSDDRITDTESYAVIYRCLRSNLANCKADDPAPKVDKYASHTHMTKPRVPTSARSIVDQFILGTFGFDKGKPRALPAVFELFDGSDSGYWNDWRNSEGNPVGQVRLMGIFPRERVVYGHFGKYEQSPLDGTGPWQMQAFVARIPSTSQQLVTVVPLPIPPGIEPRVFLGRAGPEDSPRLLMEIARESPTTDRPIRQFAEIALDGTDLGVERFTIVGSLPFFDDDPRNDMPHDFGFSQSFYARDRALESTVYDMYVANCSQHFGAVAAMPGQDVLIVDPATDVIQVVDPSPPGISLFNTAYAEPLDAPPWMLGAPTYTIVDPAIVPGYKWHMGDITFNIPPSDRPADTNTVLINYGVYRDVESLDCGLGAGTCNKLYWNTAVGFDTSVPDCTLYFDATVSSAVQLEDGRLPPGAWWPWLEATVPLTDPDGNLLCRQHPMGSPQYPAHAYPVTDATRACYLYDGAAAKPDPRCIDAMYWMEYREWVP